METPFVSGTASSAPIAIPSFRTADDGGAGLPLPRTRVRVL
ncbi:hypothetical protein [Arthrobacter sp. SAFR-044]